MPQITIATLAHEARKRGYDTANWERRADDNRSGQAYVPPHLANDAPPASSQFDLARFDARNRWADIPPRAWLIGVAVLRGFYSLITSPGGRGKTAWAIMVAVAAVMGQTALCGMVVRARLRVVFISGEDSGQEMMRRVRAFCQAHTIHPDDLGDRLLIIGAREVSGLTFNRTDPSTKQVVVDAAGIACLEAIGRQHRADLIIIDPLVSFFPAGLNDNAPASLAMAAISGICERLACGVVLLHHVSKGAVRGGEEASALAALGAVSISSHTRVAMSLMSLSEKEAPGLGVHPSAARDYFLVVNTKANLARAVDSELYELRSVTLPNADPAHGYPVGDKVQVAIPARRGSVATLYSDTMLRQVLVRLAQGSTSGMPYSPMKSADRDYRPVIASDLVAAFPDQTVAQREHMAASAVAETIKRGWAEQQTVRRPRTPGAKKGGASTAQGILVRWDLTPWAQEVSPGPHISSAGCNGATVCNGPSHE
jgi:hypothetical protein